MKKTDMTSIAEQLTRIEKAIAQVNFNEAERYRLTRDCLGQLMQELSKPRKYRKRLQLNEPPISSWNPG